MLSTFVLKKFISSLRSVILSICSFSNEVWTRGSKSLIKKMLLYLEGWNSMLFAMLIWIEKFSETKFLLRSWWMEIRLIRNTGSFLIVAGMGSFACFCFFVTVFWLKCGIFFPSCCSIYRKLLRLTINFGLVLRGRSKK